MRLQPDEPAVSGRIPTALVCVVGGRLDQAARPGRRRQPPARTRSPSPAARSPRTIRLREREAGVRAPARDLSSSARSNSPKQMVIAVPLPITDPAAPGRGWSGQRLQHLGGAAPLEDRVAERPGHPLQNGGSGQEANARPGETCASNSDLQVVGHENGRSRRMPTPPWPLAPRALDRQRGQVQARGPALRVLGELGDLFVRQRPRRPRSELPRPGIVHAQLVRPDLRRQALRPQRPSGKRRLGARRQRQLRARRNVPASAAMASRHEGYRAGEGRPDQDDGLLHCRQRRPQTRHDRSLDRDTRRSERVEYTRRRAARPGRARPRR